MMQHLREAVDRRAVLIWAALALALGVLVPVFGSTPGGQAALASAAPRFLDGPVRAEVLDVIDGDTLVARVHVWLDLTLEVRVRLRGIDTPETDGACAAERTKAAAARARLKALIAERPVTLGEISHDKFAGRVLAVVTTDQGIDAGAALIAEGLALAYRGRGQRPDWCALS